MSPLAVLLNAMEQLRSLYPTERERAETRRQRAIDDAITTVQCDRLVRAILIATRGPQCRSVKRPSA